MAARVYESTDGEPSQAGGATQAQPLEGSGFAADGRWHPPTALTAPPPPPTSTTSTPTGPKPRSRSFWVVAISAAGLLAALAVVIVIAASDASEGRYYNRPVTTDHRTELAHGESTVLADQLATVPGYHYLDPLPMETFMLTSWLEESGQQPYRAASMHSVVADELLRNTTQGEVGFLVLAHYADPVPTFPDDELAQGGTLFYNSINGNSIDGSPIEILEFEDISVYLYEDRTTPFSRYVYTWHRNDVQGFIDGAERPEIERWLEIYLSLLEQGQ